MTHGAEGAPRPAPRANLVSARGCEVCRGWGTVITSEGLHEPCAACQTDVPHQVEPAAGSQPARGHDR
jgi:hypothetical protein